MIDAYEIGINLLLQDDVSAGLAAIGKELADVDRAIATTSAGFATLVREAERAAKAASAVGSGKTAPITGAEAAAPSAADHDAVTARPRATDAAAPPGQSEAPPVEPAPAQERPAKPVSAALTSPERSSAPEAGREVSPPAMSTAPPQQETVMHPAGRSRSADGTPDLPDPSAGVPPKDPALLPTTTEVIHRETVLTGPSLAPVSKTPSMDNVAPGPIPAITAAIPTLASREAHEPPPGIYRDKSAPYRPREPAIAPRAHVRERRPEGDAPGPADPMPSQSQSHQKGEEDNGGTVMLDGRLLGQWLTNAMSRDASRPPSGTSFFDPRQTPAWHISGAL